MAANQSVHIPDEWGRAALEDLQGVLLVIGGVDTGKTTFTRYLYEQLSAQGGRLAAFLDGDPGQSTLGPPATLTLMMGGGGGTEFPPRGRMWRYFIGSTTPSGHMLSTLVGTARLATAAQAHAAGRKTDLTIIHDTSGLIDPAHGGLALKAAKIELLRPTIVFALQREDELEPLLVPLRRSRRVPVITLQPSPLARRRQSGERRRRRTELYAAYFSNARTLVVPWTNLAVFPFPRFSLQRLVAFEDVEGFTTGLGIVTALDRPNRRVTLLTPIRSLEGVNALRLGDINVDPVTFQDAAIGGKSG